MNNLQLAVNWALIELEEGQSPQDHGFVDLVRKYLNDNQIEYPPISFTDIEPLL